MSEQSYRARPIRELVAHHIGGGTPARQVVSYWKGDIPWASVKDFSESSGVITDAEEHISRAALQASASNLIPAGTPLVCTRMAVGRSAMPSVPMAINQDVKALFPKTGVSGAFLLKLLQFIQPKAEAQAIGSTVKGIRIQDFLAIEVPVAEDTSQSVIVQVLDTLDAVIQETEAVVAKLRAVKKGLLHDLLTRGIDANGELRPPQPEAPHLYRQSALGWIPREWSAKELASLVDASRPIVYGILMPGYGYPGGIPVVKVKDISEGKIQLDNLLLTSPQLDREYNRSRLVVGDLLFTIRGSVGRTALVPPELKVANITQDTARVAIKGIDSRFVRAYLDSEPSAKFIAIHTLGVAVQGINIRDVRRIPIAAAPFDEARKIADQIDAIGAQLYIEEVKSDKLKIIKSGLMDDLLTGRVRVTPLLQDSPAARSTRCESGERCPSIAAPQEA